MHVPCQLLLLGRLVDPDVAVGRLPSRTMTRLITTDVQRAGAVDALLEGGGDAGELDDPVAPLGADDALAEACRYALKNIVHEHDVAGEVARHAATAAAATATRASPRGQHAGVGRVLLLEVDQAFRHGRLVDLAADLHAAARQVAEQVPPLRVHLEGGIRHPCDETGDLQQVINLSQIRVGERMSSEPPQ